MKTAEAVTTAYHAGAKMKRIPFNWDMRNIDSIEVNHGLDLDHIQFVTTEPIQITIADDSDKAFTGLLRNGGGYTLHVKTLTLYRPACGLYDGPNYDDINAIRGYVIIFYKPKP